MKLQNLSLEQLKEIVDGAPDKTADYFIADRSAREYYSLEFGSCFSSELGEWEDSDFRTEGELKNIYRHVLNLSDIRAQIEKIEAQKDINVTLSAESIENKGFDGSEKPVFKVGDRVVPESEATNLIRAVREVLEVDGDQIKYHMEAQVRSYWSKAKGWRHATPEEIAAGHRIDSVSAEMASPCPASDSAINPAKLDLQGNKTDKITAQLNPAKCGEVNPALAYDELGFDDMTIAHRSPACKCDTDVSQPAPMTQAELKAPIGQKHDQGKPRYSLIPSSALASIVDVLEFGATKYAPNGWKHVKNARERYYNASMRHIQAWWTGEQNDPETGLPHLAHAVCSLMFLMALKGEQGE